MTQEKGQEERAASFGEGGRKSAILPHGITSNSHHMYEGIFPYPKCSIKAPTGQLGIFCRMWNECRKTDGNAARFAHLLIAALAEGRC